MQLANRYQTIRNQTVALCDGLSSEDYVIQVAEFVSPAKWHLAHTTWFFETFILKPNVLNYREFNAQFGYLFNSYYESVGSRTIRHQRGFLSRPTVEEIESYRTYVDQQMLRWLSENEINESQIQLIELGLQHEQQHQELLITDLKYNLSFNEFDVLLSDIGENDELKFNSKEINIDEGIYEIGFNGDGFCFDNELNRHKVYLNSFSISSDLITNSEYIEFIEDGGYKNPLLWHSEGWAWVKNELIEAPLYWKKTENEWVHFTRTGTHDLPMKAPVTHISFYEASAFAEWKGKRLPTEAEWEVASDKFSWGKRWEWTNSAYLPYPGYRKAPGAIGEYNGKFMVNQMVLRGASIATPSGHSRATYRNFFHPNLRWQFTGIRLASDIS
jgi:ergothioneine biosynthesis protein EgtB